MTLDNGTLHQAIETLRAAGVIAVPEEPTLAPAPAEKAEKKPKVSE